MTRYAHVTSNTVDNIVESAQMPAVDFGGFWVADSEGAAQIGGGWDGQAFSAPPQPPQPAPDRIITRLAFRKRFTDAEKIGLEMASLDRPDAADELRQQAAMLRVYLKDLDSAAYVDLDDPATSGGVQMLESAGLLAQGRASEILTTPIQPDERP